ncbi:MFS quinate transporter QutD [Crassisporium funariophilum]|nr:MFS quinate transporter QutD [Crassisporium funariophilum]
MGKSHSDGIRNPPPEIYNWRVYLAAIISTFAAVMIGYDSAFIGTSISLSSFKDEFGLSSKPIAELNFLSANIVSVYQAGSFFGAIIGYPIGFYWGRKQGLMASSLVFCLGAILHSKTGLGILYAGRIIVGLGIGVASNLAPIYVAEIAPPAIRGRLVGIYEFFWQVGGVVGFWINYGVTRNLKPGHSQWLIAFAVQLIPGGILLLGSPFLVESPRWLVSRDRHPEAYANLCYLRHLPGGDPYVDEESVFRSRSLMKRLLVGCSLFAWQNGTGINAINYYSPTVFKSIGLTGSTTGLLTTGIFGLIKMAGAIVWLLYLVDTWGRRSLLIGGSIGGAISMFYIGAYIALAKPAEHPKAKLDSGGISAIVFFYLWTVFYSPTWNGTPWVVGAEMFPQHVRTFTQACIAASNWLFGFLIARFTPQMFAAMGYGVYLFFATLMVLSTFYVFLLLPETKQVPLERIDELFAPGLKPWRAYDFVNFRSAENEKQSEEVEK